MIGAGQDPQVPADTDRVVVRVLPRTTVTWTALDPRLVLETGHESRPSAPIAQAPGQAGVEVVYLVPAFAAPLDAAWYVTDPTTGTPLRWRVRLAPPRSRAAVLRDALEIRVTGQRGVAPQSATVLLEVRNTSSIPVVLRTDDVAVTQQDRTLPTTALGAAGIAIQPLEVRSVELGLRGVDWTQDVSLRVGAARFRLQF